MAQDGHLNGLGHVGMVQVYHDNTDILFSGVQRYFDNLLFSDVTVVTPSGRKLHCHRLVLASCSRRFAAILEQGAFVTGQELPVDGVESGALELILRFFYTGECPITIPSVLSTYDVAVKLEVQGLSQACEAFLKVALNPSTCAAFLDQSLKMKIDSVAEMCLTFARNRLEEVMLSDSFQHCSTETMLTLLTENRTQNGEALTAKGAARWLAADPKRAGLAGEVCTSLNIQMSSLHVLLQAEGENNSNGGGNNIGNGNGGGGGNGGSGGGGGWRPWVRVRNSARGNGGGSGGLAAFSPLSSAGGASLANMLMAGNGGGGNHNMSGLPQNLLNGFPAGMSIQSMLGGNTQPGQGGDLAAQLAQLTGGGGLGDNGNGLLSLLSPRGMADNPSLWNGNGGNNGGRRGSLGSGPLQQQQQMLQQQLQQQLNQQMGSGGKPPRRASAAKSSGYGNGDEDSDYETSQGSPVRESQPRGGRGGRGSRGGKRGGGDWESDGFGGRGGGGGNRNRGGMKDDGSGDGMHDDGGRQMNSSRGSVLQKGVCHVDGCSADLSQLRDYHQRFKICDYHLKLSSIMRDGVPQRFCQQCGRFHPVEQFDGYKRSCRDRLQRHNAKRRKKAEEMQQQHMGRTNSGSQLQQQQRHGNGPTPQQQQQQQQQLQQHLQQQGLLSSLTADGLGDLQALSQRMMNGANNNNNNNNMMGNGGGGGNGMGGSYGPMLGGGGVNGNIEGLMQQLRNGGGQNVGNGAMTLSNEQQQMLMEAISRGGGNGLNGPQDGQGMNNNNNNNNNMHLSNNLVDAISQQQSMMMQGQSNQNQGRRSSGGAGGSGGYSGGVQSLQQALGMGGGPGGMNNNQNSGGNNNQGNGHMSGGGGGGGGGGRNSGGETTGTGMTTTWMGMRRRGRRGATGEGREGRGTTGGVSVRR
ncbi:MAG: hypothetical protein WDW36_002137 [Sanguina aurantia]